MGIPKHAALLTALLITFFNVSASAVEYYRELSVPLFNYCMKLRQASHPALERETFCAACEASRQQREKVEAVMISPPEYLASLRRLDKAYHKSLWELHLLLRRAVADEDVALFNVIAALEERAPFEMGGFLKHALEFMRRHRIEVPYFVNPDAVKTGPLQYE